MNCGPAKTELLGEQKQLLSDQGVSTVLQKSNVPSTSNVPADMPPTPPAGEVAEAGAGDPAPGEGAVPRPAASKPGRRPRMKNKAFYELIQIAVRAI